MEFGDASQQYFARRHYICGSSLWQMEFNYGGEGLVLVFSLWMTGGKGNERKHERSH